MSYSKKTARRRYFYWKYRKAHPEKFKADKGFKKRADTMQKMGASKGASSFLAGLAGGGKKFRIRYGYIDENDLGSDKDSRVTVPVNDMQMALDQYNDMAWLRTRDKGKRSFIRIECSSDGGKTWPTKLFHDCQH